MLVIYADTLPFKKCISFLECLCSLKETRGIHDSMNIPKIELFFIAYTFYYKYLNYRFVFIISTPEVSSTMRAIAGDRCSGTYLYSCYVKPDISTTSARERSHR